MLTAWHDLPLPVPDAKTPVPALWSAQFDVALLLLVLLCMSDCVHPLSHNKDVEELDH